MDHRLQIGPPLDSDGEREIRWGPHVAYGTVQTDGVCWLFHAPTQVDFDAIAARLDAATEEEIVSAMEHAE